MELHGIDIRDQGLRQSNFTMHVGDAADLPFDTSEFDLVISMGVLEHINPIEKLSEVVSEIARVGKGFVVMVPSISTILEPHLGSLFWPLRANGRKPGHENLSYFADDTWLYFTGFRGASLRRFQYMPVLKTDLCIYRLPPEWSTPRE